MSKQTELSRRIDQRIGLFLANTAFPPSRWTYRRQETPPTITYILCLDGVEAGRLVLAYTLTNIEHLAVIPGQKSEAFRKFSASIIRDLEFWYRIIWLAEETEEEQ